jgi:hypothetical protein
MTTPEDDDRQEPTPQDRGPGASSGHESQVRERLIPGTASAAEGYQTEKGDILAGVRARPGETARPPAEEEGPDEGAELPPGDQGDEPPEDERPQLSGGSGGRA